MRARWRVMAIGDGWVAPQPLEVRTFATRWGATRYGAQMNAQPHFVPLKYVVEAVR